jgi:transglutaminase-like putative cysteine protease
MNPTPSSTTTLPKNQAEPLYLSALRALLHAGAATILLMGLALPTGLLAGILGAMSGVVAARILGGLKARATTAAMITGGALLASALSRWALTGPALGPQLLGLDLTLALADALTFGFALFAVSLGLRSLADRVASLALLEVAALTGIVVWLVAGHRDLVVSEPRWLTDPAWTYGLDPRLIITTLGALTLATVPLVLLVRQRATKAALSVSALVFLGLIVFLLLRLDPPAQPPPPETLGLAGKPEDGQGGHGQGRPGAKGGKGGKGSQDPQEMPFSDDGPDGNPKPVAVVILEEDYHPPGGYFYLRQTAFSQYNGYRLVRSLRDNTDLDLADRFPTERLEIEEVPTDPDYAHPLRSTVALIADHRQPFGILQPTSFESVENPNPSYFRRAFAVESLAPTAELQNLLGFQANDPDWDEATRKHYTTFPDDDRYEKLADEIVADLSPEHRKDPIAQAVAIRRWLEKNTTYTRKADHAGATDPVADFLFGDRRGYCVHLSHSMAFLLRARGIPSRVSAGYAADESRRGTGSSILIQNQDAHAWAELYLDGPGWVVMDVSPENVDDPGFPPVNEDLQRQLGELARGDESAGKSIKPRKKPPLLKYAGLVLGPMALLAFLLMYAIKLWRRVIWRLAPPKHVGRTAYRATLDRLAEAGQARDYGETREAFARRLSDAVPSLDPMTRAVEARAMGSLQPDLPREAWGDLQAQAKAQIAQRHPRWRRFLGLLNPISWLRVR